MEPSHTAAVTAEGRTSTPGSQSEHWQIGLPTDIQRNVLEWARPILRGLSIKRGNYIKNGISAELEEVTIEIIHVNFSARYRIQLWRDGLTYGSNRYGRTQASDAAKWIRGRVTPASSRLTQQNPW